MFPFFKSSKQATETIADIGDQLAAAGAERDRLAVQLQSLALDAAASGDFTAYRAARAEHLRVRELCETLELAVEEANLLEEQRQAAELAKAEAAKRRAIRQQITGIVTEMRR